VKPSFLRVPWEPKIGRIIVKVPKVEEESVVPSTQSEATVEGSSVQQRQRPAPREYSSIVPPLGPYSSHFGYQEWDSARIRAPDFQLGHLNLPLVAKEKFPRVPMYPCHPSVLPLTPVRGGRQASGRRYVSGLAGVCQGMVSTTTTTNMTTTGVVDRDEQLWRKKRDDSTRAQY